MRSRKVGSDRLLSKNRLDALTRADFSSSVSSLGTHLADTCDIPRSAVKTRWAVDLLQPALTATSRTVFRRSLSLTFLTARVCFLSLYGGRPRGELSVNPLLNLPCHLYTSCLDTFLYLSVLCICFNVCMGVIPPSTQKLITVLRAVASSKVVIFFNFQTAAVYVYLVAFVHKWRKTFETWHADVRIIMTSAQRDVFAHFRVTVSKTDVKRKCFDYISKQILTWSVHPYLC